MLFAPGAPFRVQRIICLALLNALAITATALGINGLVKFEQAKRNARNAAPPGVNVDIVTGTLVPVGILVAIACASLNGLTSFLLIVRPLATRYLRLQTGLFIFLSLFLISVLIPFTDFYATRTAKFSVVIAGQQVPASVVKSIAGAEFSSLVYKNHPQIKAAVIVSWVVLPFAWICAALTFKSRRAATAPGVSASRVIERSRDSEDRLEKEKESVEVQESQV